MEFSLPLSLSFAFFRIDYTFRNIDLHIFLDHRQYRRHTQRWSEFSFTIRATNEIIWRNEQTDCVMLFKSIISLTIRTMFEWSQQQWPITCQGKIEFNDIWNMVNPMSNKHSSCIRKLSVSVAMPQVSLCNRNLTNIMISLYEWHLSVLVDICVCVCVTLNARFAAHSLRIGWCIMHRTSCAHHTSIARSLLSND